MKRIKFFVAILVSLSLCLPLAACGKEDEIVQDDSPLTMYVGLGITTGDYYSQLHEAILENTGIDVHFEYTNTLDTTNSMVSMLKNYDLPADIIITASFSPEEAQKESLLDLTAYTNIPDLFASSKMRQVSVEGSIYQLPYYTRLIGIEYNKTLLNELGLSLPNNFNEMLALKEKVEAAGYTFAVCGGAATGHGFNYLMYVMGTDFLAGPEGDEWLDKFQSGETDISLFKEEAEYFREYAQAGLYGEMCEKWSSAAEFKSKRALFYYNITNDALSEEGGDEYGMMPWISRNGSCNCFATYDVMYLGLDKKLAQPDQADKLAKAIRVMEFMTSETAIKLFTDMFPDGYVATSGFEITEDRMYYDYKDQLEKGYTMPWFYNSFDADSIIITGQKVNDYIKGKNDVGFDDIMDALELTNSNHLAGKAENSVNIKEEFGYEDCAKLQAAANGISLQSALDNAGINETVEISLVPYIESVEDLPVGQSTGAVQQKLYEGSFSYTIINSIVNKYTNVPSAIKMTGAEIKAFAEAGYNLDEDFEENVCFKYAMLTKNAMNIDDNKTYVVAVAEKSMPQSIYQSFVNEGKVIMSEDKAITGNTVSGLTEIFNEHPQLKPGNYWMK